MKEGQGGRETTIGITVGVTEKICIIILFFEIK